MKALAWLLEEKDPGVRYLALRDLLHLAESDPKLQAARKTAHEQGPIAAILKEMDPEGWWVRPGPGYNPKYRSVVWSLLLLAQLGASVKDDARIGKACSYLLEHTLTPAGQFSENGTPSGTIDCLQGNMCWALMELGFEEPRLDKAFEWMARSQTGEGIAARDEKEAELRYHAYKCGPDFCCGVNGGFACAWGAVKVMLAFSKLPKKKRTSMIDQAIQRGVDLIFSIEPVTADWPTRTGGKPSLKWRKFGFPVFYVTDLLQVAEALVPLGYGLDPRLARLIDLIQSKQDEQGRWNLENEYIGKSWVDFGEKNQPNKWVTLRALRILSTLG